MFYYYFLAVLGVELRASYLLDGHSTIPATPQSFCFSYFWERVLCLGLGWP
jgi:hypothetical protein